MSEKQVIRDFCMFCNKETEQIQTIKEFGAECFCRACKNTFGKTNPTSNPL